ncbi:hypothetical protein TNCV_4699631 [Trichonephila clavipes]|nr:hypothetical protein TNCV_4699631 [Trichonephila clavipes]
MNFFGSNVVTARRRIAFISSRDRYRVLMVLCEEERSRLIQNIANHLVKAQAFIQERAVNNFAQVDVEFGRRLKDELEKIKVSSPVWLLL